MNSRPMILRFSSGSVTPASASRNCSAASTTLSRTPVAATKSRSTCSASPARSSPWSTNTQVSWSPIARCTSAAATAESTPPDSPQMTRLPPTCARIASTCSSMMLASVHVDGRPRCRTGNAAGSAGRARCAAPPGGTARRPGVGSTSSKAATGAPVDAAGDGEPRRRHGDRVAVAHPHLLRGGQPAQEHAGLGDGRASCGRTPTPPVCGDLAAERLRHRLEAVADAEHRHAGREQRRVGACGAPSA